MCILNQESFNDLLIPVCITNKKKIFAQHCCMLTMQLSLLRMWRRINKQLNQCLMDVDFASVYLGRLLCIHLTGVHQDYLEGAGHVPHACLHLLQGGTKEQCEHNVCWKTPAFCCGTPSSSLDTCKAKTRRGGRTCHSEWMSKPNGFVGVSRKNITWCFSLTWVTTAAKVRVGVVSSNQDTALFTAIVIWYRKDNRQIKRELVEKCFQWSICSQMH